MNEEMKKYVDATAIKTSQITASIIESKMIEIFNGLINEKMISKLDRMEKLKPFISQRQAYSEFGEANVKRWINKGLIQRHKDNDRNGKVRLEYAVLLDLARRSNRQ